MPMILIIYCDTRRKRSRRTRNVAEDNNINFWWQFLSTISRFQISSTEFNPQPANSVVETNLTSCSSSLPLSPSLSFILCPCSPTKKRKKYNLWYFSLLLFPLMAVFLHSARSFTSVALFPEILASRFIRLWKPSSSIVPFFFLVFAVLQFDPPFYLGVL